MTREPPHNFDAEQALLGAILSDNGAFHRVGDLRAEHFADPLHCKLFGAMSRMIERGQLASPVSLKTFCDSDDDLRGVGGMAYLARLGAAAVHAVDAAEYGRIVTDCYRRRLLITLANQTAADAHKPGEESAGDLIERLERELYAIDNGQGGGGSWTLSRALTASLTAAEAAHKRHGQLTGVGTGLRDLDEMLGGLHRSDLIILAARPAMGKTALGTNIGFHAAQCYRTETGDDGRAVTVDGARVGFFSLEMSAEQLATRILAEQAGVASDRIRRGKLTNAEIDKLLAVTPEIERAPLSIDPTGALSIGALRTRARRLQRAQGLDLIIVDYLQLLSSSERKENRVQEVSEITRGLKALAKELDVPVVALSQLSRKVEDRADKRPQLADLRESGSIEQDADVVMFIYREEYYLRRDGFTAIGDKAGVAELLVEKNRHGPTGSVTLAFDAATTKFSDASARDFQRAA